MKNELLSVIVPIYNVEQYITECIESLINSEYRNLEIILVDDGSPDNCGQICDDYQKKDNRIKVIHKENGGLISARKAGIEVANGYYVTFVDGDDKIFPYYYQKAFEAMEELPDAMILAATKDLGNEKTEIWHSRFSSGYYDDDNKKLRMIATGVLLGSDGKYRTLHSLCTMLVKTDIYREIVDLVDNKVTIYEDAIFSLCCLSKAKSIRIQNENDGYFYRNTEGSMLKGREKDIFPARKIYANNLINLKDEIPHIIDDEIIRTDLFRVAIKQMADYRNGTMYKNRSEYKSLLKELTIGDNPISESFRNYPLKKCNMKITRRLHVYLMRIGIFV